MIRVKFSELDILLIESSDLFRLTLARGDVWLLRREPPRIGRISPIVGTMIGGIKIWELLTDAVLTVDRYSTVVNQDPPVTACYVWNYV